MSGITMYLAIGLPVLALAMAGGALLLTKRTHERYRDALAAERRDSLMGR